LRSSAALPKPSETASRVVGTVYYENEHFVLKLGEIDKKGAAYGSFEQTVNETGWGVLNVVVNAEESGIENDELLMEAAGYLEGALTHELIYYNYLNIYGAFFNGEKPDIVEKAKDWYKGQRMWMEGMIAKEANKNVLWHYAAFLLRQFYGLYNGYNAVAPGEHKLDLFVFDFLNGNGDYLDLQNVLDPSKMPDFDKMSEDELTRWISKSGHCSALIKMAPGYENVYAGHSSWFIYTAMLRIYKHYNFVLNDKNYAAQRVSFSSYPAYLSSLDDFYIMDSKVIMLQTTNGIYNKAIYANVTQDGLLAWHRVRVANWLASGGREWCDIVRMYNTGTYNNQYMVLDLKKFHLNNVLEDDALWVAEQVPGYVHIGDQTAILREGYWASYNVPFYEDIFEMSGYAAMEKTKGPSVSHDLAPRAKIFRRDEGKVTSVEAFEHIMRYNDYKDDPYSKGSPMNAICSRGDLESTPSLGGCYDTKVTDYEMAMQMTSLAISGPTYQDQPIFSWRNFPNVSFHAPHYGQPVEFNFPFVRMAPADI
jgi:hypothetical protein